MGKHTRSVKVCNTKLQGTSEDSLQQNKQVQCCVDARVDAFRAWLALGICAEFAISSV